MTSPDLSRAQDQVHAFKPLLVGLHWPSQPWGDEDLAAASFALGTANAGAALFDAYLARLGDRPAIREPLRVIIDEARRNISPPTLPPHVRKAYADLNAALGLGADGVSAPPDADREGFDPDDAYEAGNEEGTSYGGDLNLGGLLGPLRQLSYWTMKKRARAVGEGGMHRFLVDMQRASPASVHLMGHSFGTIVVSGMVAGPDAQGPLPRPVDSLVLVQGAVSLWSYASPIPIAGAGDGYFARTVADRKVRGAIVTTRSRHDLAVGVMYPLASRLYGKPNFVPGQKHFPKFGAIGAFGLQGIVGAGALDQPMQPLDGDYAFSPGGIYNLEASTYIAKMDGASGAHSDIAGPEVAHAIWSAALASQRD
jgi:hypothetical protein